MTSLSRFEWRGGQATIFERNHPKKWTLIASYGAFNIREYQCASINSISI